MARRAAASACAAAASVELAGPAGSRHTHGAWHSRDAVPLNAAVPRSLPVQPVNPQPKPVCKQVHTLFPAAKSEEGIKGGVVLLRLAPPPGATTAAAPPLRLEARYTDRSGWAVPQPVAAGMQALSGGGGRFLGVTCGCVTQQRALGGDEESSKWAGPSTEGEPADDAQQLLMLSAVCCLPAPPACRSGRQYSTLRAVEVPPEAGDVAGSEAEGPTAFYQSSGVGVGCCRVPLCLELTGQRNGRRLSGIAALMQSPVPRLLTLASHADPTLRSPCPCPARRCRCARRCCWRG